MSDAAAASDAAAPAAKRARLPALAFSGRNRHRGVAVTRGTRYILAGFCEFAQDPKAS